MTTELVTSEATREVFAATFHRMHQHRDLPGYTTPTKCSSCYVEANMFIAALPGAFNPDALRKALEDIAMMLPGSVPQVMTEEEYLRAMLHECVGKARWALANLELPQ